MHIIQFVVGLKNYCYYSRPHNRLFSLYFGNLSPCIMAFRDESLAYNRYAVHALTPDCDLCSLHCDRSNKPTHG